MRKIDQTHRDKHEENLLQYEMDENFKNFRLHLDKTSGEICTKNN